MAYHLAMPGKSVKSAPATGLFRQRVSDDLKRQIIAGKLSPAMTFNQRVWALTARIPAGKVLTYGDIARQLNCSASRAVGNALNRNPFAPAVPCHRVVGSDGRLAGYAGGLAKKKSLLQSEGVRLIDDRVDLAACRWVQR